jgi:hypothetical protein
MQITDTQFGWYCGLQGPFAEKSQALALRKNAVKVGYKLPQVEAITYRIDSNVWKSPNILVEKNNKLPK